MLHNFNLKYETHAVACRQILKFLLYFSKNHNKNKTRPSIHVPESFRLMLVQLILVNLIHQFQCKGLEHSSCFITCSRAPRVRV